MGLLFLLVPVTCIVAHSTSPFEMCDDKGPSGHDSSSISRCVDPPMNLLQVKRQNAIAFGEGLSMCNELTNKGAYFTVDVEVGTPPQRFQVVADTGSNYLIVPSCLCHAMQNGCIENEQCFTGGNRSSTFVLSSYNGSNVSGTMDNVAAVEITFGSGALTAVVATDVARIGTVNATLENGLFLMVDRRKLAIEGRFEGILGLGPPRLDDQTDPPASWRPHGQAQGQHMLTPPMFLERANMTNFSICFNDDGKPGIMRFGASVTGGALGSVGTAHWGLALNGLSSGNETNFIDVCTPSSMPPGQETPCGMIPDTGTTLITGPQDGIYKIFEKLCGEWPRCSELAADDLSLPKHSVFKLLLENCADWLDDTQGKGLGEIPSIFIHAAGAGGAALTIELSAWAYITESSQEEIEYVKTVFDSILPVQLGLNKGQSKKVCTPSFGPMDYNTEKNGPVWIFGTPLFYEYTVGFDIGPRPPTMAFEKRGCPSSCESDTSLFSPGSTSLHGPQRARVPRKGFGVPRHSSIDVTRPL